MSLLAERFDGGQTRLSSHDIAEVRNLPQPLVAKILTILSNANLVCGTRGPGGGYWLAQPPQKITLGDIAMHFEKDGGAMMCPFGPDWCGKQEPCPLHDNITQLYKQWDHYLNTTTLAVFIRASDEQQEESLAV